MDTFSALVAFCEFLHKGQWRGVLMFSLICSWIHGWVNNGEAGDLRCHRAHYYVIVMGNDTYGNIFVILISWELTQVGIKSICVMMMSPLSGIPVTIGNSLSETLCHPRIYGTISLFTGRYKAPPDGNEHQQAVPAPAPVLRHCCFRQRTQLQKK